MLLSGVAVLILDTFWKFSTHLDLATIGDFDFQFSYVGYSLALRTKVDAFPSWGSAVGWIIWYVALFGGSKRVRSEAQGSRSLGFTMRGKYRPEIPP